MSDEERLFNTVPAAEFFNEHRFAPDLVGNRLLYAVPTILTTLGLVGTFFGLTVGLRHLDLNSSSGELQSGVQALVEGAALAFTASFWGVAMSLVMNFYERRKEQRVVREMRALQDEIDSLFSMRSPEHSLSTIAQATTASSLALEELHEKIGSTLQEAITSVGTETSRAVQGAIIEALAPAMEGLARTAADQSAAVFQEISEQFTKAFAGSADRVAQEMEAASEAMRQTLDSMGTQLAQHADEHRERMSQMQEAANQQLRQVVEATEQQIAMLNEALPQIVTGLDAAAGKIGDTTAGLDSVIEGLSSATSQLTSTSDSLATVLGDSVASTNALAEKTAAAARSITDHQVSLTELTNGASAAAEHLRTTAASLTHGFTGIEKAQGVFLENLEKRLLKHSEATAGWLDAYAAKVNEHTATRMDEWNKHTEQFTSGMLTATQALSDAIDELGSRNGTHPATASAQAPTS